MEVWILLIVIVSGLSFGSFLGMAVSRLEKMISPSKKKLAISLFSGRSFCDNCKNKLKWWENVPTISFLALKGKCRCCHSPIPFWYLLIELATAAAFLLTFLFWQNNFLAFGFSSLVILLVYFLISLLLIFILFFDWRVLIIPDEAVVALLGLTLVEKLIVGFSLVNLYSSLGAFIFLFLLFLLTKGKGMGFGDVKFALFMGFFLGWPEILVAFYLAFLTGSLVGVIMILAKKAKFKQKIAFGPFLVLATFAGWWWGENIFAFVLRWLKI